MDIMLVDDEPFIREGLKRLVDWGKYDCHIAAEAGNGMEALETLKDNSVDILFADIKMPGMTGLEMIEEIRRQKITDAVIVILTGFADFEFARSALRLGVKDFLLKPVQAAELERLLGEIIKSNPHLASKAVGKQKNIIEDIDEYIVEHYRENLSLKQLSEVFYVNNVYLGQLFKKRHNMLFKDYINDLRINEAEKILTETDKRIYAIAEELGFPNADVFISKFVQQKGITPNQYRIKNRMRNEKVL